MKKFITLSLCLSLSLFAVARAMTLSHTLATVAKAAQERPFDMSEAEEQDVPAEEDTDEDVASNDDDSMDDASDNEGEDMSDDDSGDDDAGDDNGGDDGSDDGGD